MQQSEQSINPWLYFVAFWVFIGLRVVMWLSYAASPIPFGPISDAWLYLELGKQWISSEAPWLNAFSAKIWPNEAVFHSPLYPYLVGLLYKSSGSTHFGLLLEQNLAGVLSSFILLKWIDRFCPTRRRAWAIAMLLIPVNLVWVSFEWKLLPVSFAIFFQLMLIEFAYQFACKPRTPLRYYAYLLGSALALALLILLRPNFLLLWPCTITWAFWMWRKHSASMAPIITFSLLPILCIAPFVHRNQQLGAGYKLSANSGITFHHGNQERSRGYYTTIPGVSRDISQQNKDALKSHDGKKLSIAEADRHWLNQGVMYLTRNPWQGIKLWATKLWLFCYPRESGGSFTYAFESQQIGALKFLSLGNFSLLLFLAVIGYLLNWKRNHLDPLVFSAFFVSLATCVIFYFNTRYRLPAWPLLIPYACAGLTALLDSLRSAEKAVIVWRKPMVGIVCAAIAIMLLFYRNQPHEEELLLGWHNFGVAYEHAVEPEEALEVYKKVLEMDPNHVPTLENMSRSYIVSYQAEKAVEVLYKLMLIKPDSRTGLHNLALALMRLGEFDAAKVYADRLIKLTPNNRATRHILATIHYKLGNKTESCDELKKAQDLGLRLKRHHPLMLLCL